jgi:phosphoribosylformylglycinamidine synthase
VALRYADGHNVNGSMNAIAGICDVSGLVFGLMPHPERFTKWTQHPRWTRLDQSVLANTPLGLAMFRNAVRHAQAQRV